MGRILLEGFQQENGIWGREGRVEGGRPTGPVVVDQAEMIVTRGLE